MKVVINKCYGGYGISKKALLRMRELGSEAAKKEPLIGEPWDDTGKICDRDYDTFYLYGLPRHDPILVRVVEEMKEEASGPLAELRVVEVPDGVEYEIQDYDGIEHIAETHRTWG